MGEQVMADQGKKEEFAKIVLDVMYEGFAGDGGGYCSVGEVVGLTTLPDFNP